MRAARARGATDADRLPLLRKDELARMQKLGAHGRARNHGRSCSAMLDEVRARGMARVVDTLLPGVAGFCAPVFDADGHLALGMVAMGSVATFDTAWDGAVARPLAAAARQLQQRSGLHRRMNALPARRSCGAAAASAAAC